MADALGWFSIALIVCALATCSVMVNKTGVDYSLAKAKICADAGGYMDGWGNCNPPVKP